MSQPNLAEEPQPELAAAAAGLDEEQPTPDTPKQKQKTNVYTVMLIIAFICIVTANLLLYFELTMWGDYPYWNTNEGKPNVARFEIPVLKVESRELFV